MDLAAPIVAATERTPGRLALTVEGTVQGVGFRPFVHRLAVSLDLAGWVRNGARGVEIEVEGSAGRLAAFRRRLRAEAPAGARIGAIDARPMPATGGRGFAIRAVDASEGTAWVAPDVATCPACLAEILDPANRRHRYPFTTCCACGPRYSVLARLPYARGHTTMAGFALCEECRREFEDPANRRFHAETIACPDCGPRLSLWDGGGRTRARDDEALRAAARAIREGAIVAVKGIGGFQLLADACNEAAVARLRARKRRPAKPFALLVPSLAVARELCELDTREAELLASPAAPIVLADRRIEGAAAARLAPGVAPDNPRLGLMLPHSPLHHLLAAGIGSPVVATSGNVSDEPIVADEDEALVRLAGIADALLVHDRPIARPVDDAVARVVLGRTQVLRVGRGYAPLRVPAPSRPHDALRSIVAAGGDLKSAIALTVDRDLVLSQHIGDLADRRAAAVFERTAMSLAALHGVEPSRIACDLHPDYASTVYAERRSASPHRVQHHHAHVRACMADNGLTGPVLGLAWDGTGFGADGTIWGGEFLRVDAQGFRRVAHLRPFPLPGGERAVREPRRAALGLLWAAYGPRAFELDALATLEAFGAAERPVLRRMLEAGLNAPWTSSMGRLFDAVASLFGLRQIARFEGDAAMALEGAAGCDPCAEPYPLPLRTSGEGMLIVDWQPMLDRILEERRGGVAVSVMAARFHAALAAAALGVAMHQEERDVALTGGCFQNRRLTEDVAVRLQTAGFRVHVHRRVPPNDGGLALGQLAAALDQAGGIDECV